MELAAIITSLASLITAVALLISVLHNGRRINEIKTVVKNGNGNSN